jgi:hypothetical protein
MEPVMFDDRSVFTLAIPECQTGELFVSRHDLYGATFERKIIFDEQKNGFVIQDQWSDLPQQVPLLRLLPNMKSR